MNNDEINNISNDSEKIARQMPRPRPVNNNTYEKPKLIRVNDLALEETIENLIEKNANVLRGEYSFYCVYQKTQNQDKYALIHAFYIESDTVKYENMDRIILEDGKIMHQSLLDAKLECNYFYVLLYFDYADKSKGSVLLNNRILLTNELEEFEAQLVKDGL